MDYISKKLGFSITLPEGWKVDEETLSPEVDKGEIAWEEAYETGRRREGSYFGVTAFIERLVMVLIGGSSSLVLGLSGYHAALTTQPSSVALGIRLGMGLLPVVALAVFLVALRYYPLGKEQVLALGETLDALHREKAEQITVRLSLRA